MEFAMKLNGRLPALALVLLAGAAGAQQVYRHVDANGKVSFSDQPPAAAPGRAAAPAAASGGAVTSLPSNNGLPYELRQVTQRYPVTLYTRDDCEPCSTGRSLLTTRGIPFTEKTVKTIEDNDALQRLSGQNSLPLLTIGSQQVKGFLDSEWSQYLDAAGYPRSSQLPPGYAAAPASPLVAVQAAPAATRAAAPAPRPAAPAPLPPSGGVTSDNPAGIKF